MTNDYRAMCGELVEQVQGAISNHGLCLDASDALMHRARALLDQPVAERPTDDELLDLWLDGMDTSYARGSLTFARAVLARWGHPTPQPVAVSERLPGPEDCLDEGWAWFFNQRIGWRQEVLPVSPGYTHWLPANALPTPEAKP